jgi:hypothetical protein
VIWVGCFSFIHWLIAYGMRHFYESANYQPTILDSILLVGRNAVISALVTKIVTGPLAPYFAGTTGFSEDTIIGQPCVISSSEATPTHGQAKHATGGAPLLLNVRTDGELLQKFISLCDATRKIEGVRNGRTRTFDLRGRRVAVVMAGNPYTESGERFQIPDMLSNRADVYNLGEIIGGASDAFEMSYLENCLTSNDVLAPLAAGNPDDARAMIRAAQRDSLEGIDLKGNYSADNLRSMFEVLRKLLRVRDVVLESTGTELQTNSRQQAQGPPDQTVLVQHKVPRVMLDLIKGQFHLMQEWMRPLLESPHVQSKELNQLRLRLDHMLKSYAEFQRELESAPKDNSPSKP